MKRKTIIWVTASVMFAMIFFIAGYNSHHIEKQNEYVQQEIERLNVNVASFKGKKFRLRSDSFDSSKTQRVTYHDFDFMDMTVAKYPASNGTKQEVYRITGYSEKKEPFGTLHIFNVNSDTIKQIWLDLQHRQISYISTDDKRLVYTGITAELYSLLN